MNKNISFKEWLEPLEVGSVVYKFKPYHDKPITMEVIDIDPVTSTVELKSINAPGYHYWLSEETFDHNIQELGPRSQHYYTEQAAIEALEDYDGDRREKFVKYYKNNPEDFIEEMVRKAYESEADPEYGDDVIADAIQIVAKHLSIDI